MTNEEYQVWSKSTAKYPQSYIDMFDPVYLRQRAVQTFPFYLLLGLNGECGEVTEIFKKFARRSDITLTQEEKNKVKLELGDVLWYFTQIATELGLTLSEIMEANKHKLEERYSGR